MKLDIKLDKRDRKIIGLLNDNPGISQESIAKEIHLSQPSVNMRIKKLKDKGFIEQILGINPQKIGLYIAKVDITTDNPAKLLNMYRNCPFFLNGFAVSGKNNLLLFLIGENIASIESKVNRHLRGNKEVHNVEFNIIIASEKDFIVPVNLDIRNDEKLLCGMEYECVECSNFKENKCFGCPVKNQYKGSLW